MQVMVIFKEYAPVVAVLQRKRMSPIAVHIFNRKEFNAKARRREDAKTKWGF